MAKLTAGAFGDEVRDLHNKLRQHGFDIPSAEEERRFYGPGTREVVNEFQRTHILRVTGVIDDATERALQAAAPAAARQASAVPVAVHQPAVQAPPVAPVNGSQARTNGNKVSPAQAVTNQGRADYSARDREAQVAFYVLLWKRKGISLAGFDDYWRDVHGPVCARLPGQFQYWQFHVAHNDTGIFPAVSGVSYATADDDQFDGIAELTFRSPADRQTWFDAAGILMDDEHNIFSKAIGYVTEPGNSRTYVDGLATGDPNGDAGCIKFHVLVRQAPGVSNAEFRRYLTDSFAAQVARSEHVLKFRLHLFEPPDLSRPDAAGVVHIEPPERQYQAAYELAFRNQLDLERFFASPEYAAALRDEPRFVQQVSPFPERTAYAFVYDGRMTLAGERGSRTAELITRLGATNQLRADIHDLVVGAVARNGGTGSRTAGAERKSPAPVKPGAKANLAQIYSPASR